DAKDMHGIAQKRGFRSKRLLTADATTTAVTNLLRSAAKELKKGDVLFISYSGHGGQVRDLNREEKDRYDETWVLFDRQLVDDELYALYGKFRSGVRIFVLSDSCHSGTVVRRIPAFVRGGARTRNMPWTVARKVEAAHQSLYRKVQREAGPAETAPIRSSVVLISGCQDNQLSSDGSRNGLFTGTLRRVWAGGKFKGNLRAFRDQIAARMPSDQTPNYSVVGAPNEAFEANRPFTI
ncbi:MAG TPA: caspase family protein, partial [Candidatus Eisenbacteria bacterium]|nr:caspase family protein [Candidatus Eisenbacteria bacterium]